MRAGARHQRPLLISFLLIVGFLVVQVVTGLLTGSLALLSDAGHMATDALGLGMALAAIHAASTARTQPAADLRALPPRDPRRAGQRRAAVRRGRLRPRRGGRPPRRAPRDRLDARSWSSALLGLVVNLVAFLLLRAGAKESLNVQGRLPGGPVRHARLARRRSWPPSCGASPGGPGSTRSSAPPSACSSSPGPSGSAGRPCASWCRPPRPASTCPRSRPTWPASRASSTSTTCTCGRSPPTWRWPRPTSWCRVGHRQPPVLDQARVLLERAPRPRPRHPPGRARRPPRLRRDHLVTAPAEGAGARRHLAPAAVEWRPEKELSWQWRGWCSASCSSQWS